MALTRSRRDVYAQRDAERYCGLSISGRMLQRNAGYPAEARDGANITISPL